MMIHYIADFGVPNIMNLPNKQTALYWILHYNAGSYKVSNTVCI